jgi:NADH:ubiquinone oxidoreductase subunit C
MTNKIMPEDFLRCVAAHTQQQCDLSDHIINEIAITVSADDLHDIVAALMNELNLTHLSAITAQQREDRPKEIQVMYHFWQGGGYTLIVWLPVSEPVLTSIMDLIIGADFYEREVAEMYGITIANRAETPPLLLPDDWDEGPPMRRKEEST